MTEHAVVIVGAGPTGLMLGAELVLAGVDVVIVERRVDQTLDGSRAGGLHSRTLEVLDQRGVADRFVEAGQPMQVQGYAFIGLDISDFPTRFNHGLALPQNRFEPILAGWVEELGVPILRGRDVVDIRSDAASVRVQLDGGESLDAAYVVGCDGGRSRVRKAAGIDFVGSDATTSWMIAEVTFDGEPELGFRRTATGTHALGQRTPGGPISVVLTEPDTNGTGTPTLDQLRGALHDVYDSDFGLREATWISRFTDMTRQAVAYRRGRVLLAGDAAHVHPPQGGQGLNVGVQDAVNLGWKLALVAKGAAPASLLDSYHDERHPVGARLLHSTMAMVALSTPGDRHQALRDVMTELLAMDEPRRRLAAQMSGLDVAYDIAGDHPMVGRRMPDLDLATSAGPTRTFSLLHDARPVLLDLSPGEPGAPIPDGRVHHVHASASPTCALPVLGEVDLPPALLVRPDGHVAWAGRPGDGDLPDALSRWFGPPSGP